MTFTAVGSGIDLHHATTFSASPASAGHLFVACVVTESNADFATGISGSNITWTQAGTSVLWSVFVAWYATMWLGKATTTGSATQTIAFNAGTPTVVGWTQEYSSTVGSWALDGSLGALEDTTANCPSLAPAGSGELYFCYSVDQGSPSNGSTAGYTYFIDAAANEGCWNPACTSAAQAPSFGDASAHSAVALLVKETAAAFTAPPFTAFMSSM